MDRAAKRRAAREAGYRRSESKKGRRRSIRTAEREVERLKLDALERAGFEVVTRRIEVP